MLASRQIEACANIKVFALILDGILPNPGLFRLEQPRTTQQSRETSISLEYFLAPLKDRKSWMMSVNKFGLI